MITPTRVLIVAGLVAVVLLWRHRQRPPVTVDPDNPYDWVF